MCAGFPAAYVALYTSAWIEITKKELAATPIKVALYTSAWIEISYTANLKNEKGVALYTSAWIEILFTKSRWMRWGSRTLHECVD